MSGLDTAEIIERTTYHSVNRGQQNIMDELRTRIQSFMIFFNDYCKPSRETSLALTHAEESLMFANKAVARHGVILKSNSEENAIPEPLISTEELGEKAYTLYRESCGGKSFHGEDIPEWDGVREDIKKHWIFCAVNFQAE